jgi:hypothetical protein
MVLEMIQKYNSDKPFVEEIDEIKIPEPIQDDGADEGEYITPKEDPNQPFFF